MKALLFGLILVLGSISSFAADEIPGNVVLRGNVTGTISLANDHYVSARKISFQLNKHCVATLHKSSADVIKVPAKDYKVVSMDSDLRVVDLIQTDGFAAARISYDLKLEDSVISSINCERNYPHWGTKSQAEVTYAKFKKILKKVATLKIQAI